MPTWNCIAVHLRGVLSPVPPEALEPQLDEVSARQEAGLAPKPVWTPAKMSGGGVMAVDGTWKLNQSKPLVVRQGVIAALAPQDGIAQAMAGLPEG